MDLAIAHYANNILGFPPAIRYFLCPQGCVASLRLVKDFRAALKKAVYDGGWEAA